MRRCGLAEPVRRDLSHIALIRSLDLARTESNPIDSASPIERRHRGIAIDGTPRRNVSRCDRERKERFAIHPNRRSIHHWHKRQRDRKRRATDQRKDTQRGVELAICADQIKQARNIQESLNSFRNAWLSAVLGSVVFEVSRSKGLANGATFTIIYPVGPLR